MILNGPTLLDLFTAEAISKHTPPSSPQKVLRSHKSKLSPTASHRIRKQSLVGGFASELRGSNGPSPEVSRLHETAVNRPQPHRQSKASKNQTDSPKKSNSSSEQHKLEEASADLFNSEAIFEEIKAWLQPMAPCISPISDLVRIHCTVSLWFMCQVVVLPL